MTEENQAELLAATPYEIASALGHTDHGSATPGARIAAGTRLGFLPDKTGAPAPIDAREDGYVIATRYQPGDARLTIYIAPGLGLPLPRPATQRAPG